ncbi:isoform 2 of anaphase-promoting complex subunit 7 [Fagus crenata]
MKFPVLLIFYRHCPFVLEAITALAEMGATAKDIISLFPQTPYKSGRAPFDDFDSSRWLQSALSNDYKETCTEPLETVLPVHQIQIKRHDLHFTISAGDLWRNLEIKLQIKKPRTTELVSNGHGVLLSIVFA